MGVVIAQGSRPDFWCGQGVKHEILMGQDLDPGGSTGIYVDCTVPSPLDRAGVGSCVQRTEVTI